MAIVNGLKTKACQYCQISFIPKRSWQITCGYKCGYYLQNAKKKRTISNPGNCARCNSSLENKRPQAIYCSKTCKSMDHTQKHRGNTRFATTARRFHIYERDNKTCYLCGVYLDFEKVELDHLVPISRGGDSSPENLAVSCRTCNRTRGAKIEVAQLFKINELRRTLDY